MKSHLETQIAYFILISLLAIPLFSHLGTLPIQLWDESRLAINAFEMYSHGDYLVTHYNNEPDLWNTKPPLLIWFQVLSMKWLGVNEIALRLPSVLAAFCTCFFIFITCKNIVKEYSFGIIAVLVLITSEGYIGVHGARTGDYDSLLTLFTTLCAISYFNFLQTKKLKHFIYFFLAFTLGFLTKSSASLLIMPGLLFYTLFKKELSFILKNKYTYLLGIGSLMIILTYYFMREQSNPGYLEAVWNNEFGGRYLEVLEDNEGKWTYYITNFFKERLTYWSIPILCSFLFIPFTKSLKTNDIVSFSAIISIAYLVVISYSQTKLKWYDMPMYPFLAIILGAFIYSIFNVVKSYNLTSKVYKTAAPFFFLLLVFFTPYSTVFKTGLNPKKYDSNREFYAASYFLQETWKTQHTLYDDYILVYDEYYAHHLFYLNLLEKDGIKIRLKQKTDLQPKDMLIVGHKEVQHYIETHYNFQILDKIDNVIIYTINE